MLNEALDVMESKLARETLGEHVFKWFLRNKQAEWANSVGVHLRPSATSATGELDGSASSSPPRPTQLAQALDLGGWAWKRRPISTRREQPRRRLVGAVVVAGDEPDEAFRLCRSIRSGDIHVGSVLLLIGGGHLASLDFRKSLRRLLSQPFQPVELEARLKHLFRRGGQVARAEVIEYGPLGMNETYQAAIDGEPLDLTYMEYELSKFLASHPGKVFTRETLLGGSGATTTTAAPGVDVHVRRLRSSSARAPT